MKKILSAFLAVILTAVGALPAYAQSEVGDVVPLCTYRSLGEFSPFTIDDDVEYEAVRFVFDSLYYIDENDRSAEMMGYGLEISEDYKEYRITLRDDIYWHDGSKVTVDDVIFTYNSAKNLDWFKASLRSLESVSAEGNTLVFKLKYANPVFMKETVTYVPIVPKSYYEKGEHVSIGCGAFKVVQKGENNKYVLDAIDYYLTTCNVDSIEIDVLASEEECVKAMGEARYATIFGDLSPEAFLLINDKAQETEQIYSFYSKVLFLNNEKITDSKLRKAVSISVDYDRIVNEVYKEKADKGAPGFFNNSLGYSNKGLTSYTNVEEAKQLLTSNGYSYEGDILKDSNGNGIVVNILTTDGKHEQMANIVKDAMSGLGINASVTVVDEEKLMTEVKNGNYQTAIVHLDNYYQYCESNIKLLLDNEYADYSRYNSQKASEALDRYTSTMDAYDRHDRLVELQSVIGEEVPFIPLCYPYHLSGYEKGIYNLFTYKEGVGIYSVLSFINNKKYVDSQINAKVLNGPEKGKTQLAAGFMILVLAVGFAVYYFRAKRNKDK